MLDPFIHHEPHDAARAEGQTTHLTSMHFSGEDAGLRAACILERSANHAAESVN